MLDFLYVLRYNTVKPGRKPVALSEVGLPVNLILARLAEGCPALTSSTGQALAEAATVCLEEQGHPQTVSLLTTGSFERAYNLSRLEATEQMRLCFNDECYAPDVENTRQDKTSVFQTRNSNESGV